MDSTPNYLCGYVALVGKPNTGKSTLMNALVGEKLSITAKRPQTTRHQILGIKTTSEYQCIFVDTPGMHQDQKKAINRYMNRAATSMLTDVDLICVLLDVRNFNGDDEQVLKKVENKGNAEDIIRLEGSEGSWFSRLTLEKTELTLPYKGQDGSLEVWVTIDGCRTELDAGGRELLARLEECMDGRALPEFCTLMVANPDMQLRVR